MQQSKEQSPDINDFDDDEIYLHEELICVVRNNKLQEEEKVEKIEGLLKDGADVNFKDANNKFNTPLHIAIYKNELRVIELLVKNGAKKDIKNNKNISPLDLANHFKKQNIVQMLESGIKLSGKYSRQSSNQQRTATPKQSQKKNKFSKRSGTTGGIDGHFYEIDLLTLGKLRGERDSDRFYLATNMNGLGAFDDVVIRYWSSEDEKKNSKIILLQAKHVKDPKKGKITIKKFITPKIDDGKFYLGKYFIDYLKSKEKFKTKHTDPVFNGNFKELDARYIIYTNSVLDERFDKSRIVDAESNIFSTKSKENKGEAFKFSLDARNDDLIEVLKNISHRERIKSLAKALVSCVCGKLNYKNMIENELFSTYHVFLSRNIIEVKENEEEGKRIEYREGFINPNFLEIGNDDDLLRELKEEFIFEYANSVLFKEKSSSEFGDKSKRNELVNKATESLKSSGKVDTDIIEKLGGSAIILDSKSRMLKFADENKFKNKRTKEFVGDVKNKVGDLIGYKFDIPHELIEKALKEQTEKEPLKLHVNFGNISPTLKKPDNFIRQIINLLKQYKYEKVIKIDDDMIGHKKTLSDGDIKNIGKLVGNLLVFDQKEKMLRLVNEESLHGNVQRVFKKLKLIAQSEGLDLDGYRFDIKVKTFPRDSLINEEDDRDNVKEFLSKLEIFTGQASDSELQEIIKDEIRDLYKLKRDEVEKNFLDIRDKAVKFWIRGDNYLEKNDDFFTNILRFNIQFEVTAPTVSFTGRDEELKQLHKILQDENKATISQVACITGLGGIGKSELARKYISDYGNSYHGNLIWINAKCFWSLTNSFYKLAKRTLDSIKDAEGNKKNLKLIVEDVYRFFGRRKALFIFDDAIEYKKIKRFLPPTSNLDNKMRSLITSRNRDWNLEEERKINVLILEVFKPDEAEEFVEGFLEINDNSQKEDVKELTKQLQYLPLALRQAAAYIQEEDKRSNKRGGEKFQIRDYLQNRQKEQALVKDYYKNSNRCNKTVFTTWLNTLKKIAEDPNYGRQAIDILNVMAYFTSDKIDVTGLFSMEKTDERWNAVELLDRYSMINLVNGVVDIHSLVQEVTRHKLNRENKEKRVLKEALEGIDDLHISEEDISHVISVWDYASKHQNLIRQFCSNSRYGKNEDTPLHLFARSGNEEGINRILKILPEMKDSYNATGETPLYDAIIKDDKEILNV